MNYGSWFKFSLLWPFKMQFLRELNNLTTLKAIVAFFLFTMQNSNMNLTSQHSLFSFNEKICSHTTHWYRYDWSYDFLIALILSLIALTMYQPCLLCSLILFNENSVSEIYYAFLMYFTET